MSPIALNKVFKANIRHSLSYRLLSYILACSTLLALLITALQLFWDYRQDRGMVESSLNQIEASFLQPIASSLWNLDEEQIQVQLEGIMNLPSMQFVEVKEAMGDNEVRLQSLGKELPSYDISREFDLVYQGEKVGKLFVASSLEMIYHRLMEKSIIILVSQTIKTLVVSFCILLIIYYKVIRHTIASRPIPKTSRSATSMTSCCWSTASRMRRTNSICWRRVSTVCALRSPRSLRPASR